MTVVTVSICRRLSLSSECRVRAATAPRGVAGNRANRPRSPAATSAALARWALPPTFAMERARFLPHSHQPPAK